MADESPTRPKLERAAIQRREITRVTASDVLERGAFERGHVPERVYALREYHALSIAAQFVITELVRNGSESLTVIYNNTVALHRKAAQQMDETNDFLENCRLTQSQMSNVLKRLDDLDGQYFDALSDHFDSADMRLNHIAKQDPLAYRREAKGFLERLLER